MLLLLSPPIQDGNRPSPRITTDFHGSDATNPCESAQIRGGLNFEALVLAGSQVLSAN
jgi:hypothetical protein